jgi:predicted dehydrogenase
VTAPFRLGILGCGDFLRWNEGALLASTRAKVAAVFDPDAERRRVWSVKLGAREADSAKALLTSPEVDAVCLFVPPWIRREQVGIAAGAGKHILTTKPLAPNVDECRSIQATVAKAGVRCGVIYSRTRKPEIETLKTVLDSGEIGRLTLYKQDWIHAYPRWNSWATDPEKNGGPFMDAMIHNLNAARYLIGKPLAGATFFKDTHAQQLPCADTESMKLDFAGGASAHLFITWAADLATYGTQGNDREHIDLFYGVTDQGWRVTLEGRELVASRRGERKTWPLRAPDGTIFDAFANAVAGGPWPRDLPDVSDAMLDIALVRQGMAKPSQFLAAPQAVAGAQG